MIYKPELYMHDLDKKAFAALNKFPAFLKLQEAYITNVNEKAAKIEFLSTAIRLSKQQMPETYSLLPPICDKLGIALPDLYMVKSKDKKDLNAFTGGITEPFICVTSELIAQLSSEMVSSVIAHECGHIACKHYLYHSLARNFVNGITESPLSKISAVRKYISKTLVTALLFWDRCSELSADRAAVLCDGNSDLTIEMLLKLHGFGENINRNEFIKQALDLKDFVNASKSNQLMEQMVVQWNSHPLLATRAYECHDWANSKEFLSIINGTATEKTAKPVEIEEKEVINADVSVSTSSSGTFGVDDVPPEVQAALEQRLHQVNTELERYTNYADKVQYAYSIACGIITGWLDSSLFADTTIFNNDLGFSHMQVNDFIQEYAKARGLGGDRLKDCIIDLEDAFKVAQDNVWKGANIGVSAKNHHLADLAHHPTPVGLISALIVQFMRIGTFVNNEGKWHFKFVPTTKDDIVKIVIPAVITGFLNWLAAISEDKYEAETGKEMPKAIHKLAHIIASSPEMIEIIKCADNWFGHLVSDMGGSRSSADKTGGMGIPGIFLSLLHEVSALPILKDSSLPAIVNDLYVNKKLDLRHELAYAEQLILQTVPVLFNEICVRIGFMILELEKELLANGGFKGINWRRVIPLANRSVDRCVAIAAMTFNVVDTGDAALRAAIESGGNWVVFSGRFVARYNFVGAGRAALAIVKEVSNESKESQLIHERMILMGAKADMMLRQLQQFKAQLEERVSNYLAEDIEAFIEGFDYMNEGFSFGDSNLVIKGNVIIQKVLGRDPQFTTQEEFDDLMESDIPLQF